MTRQSLSRSQQGIISIMMTMVMVIVISLIVLGMAQLSRREQRQAGDAQLSSEAFYAAESGVNDMAALLAANTGSITARTSCTDTTAPYNQLTSTINSGSNVAYTCVLANPTPTTLSVDLSKASTVLPLRTTTGGAVGSLVLSWSVGNGQNLSGYTSCPTSASVTGGTGDFEPAGSWSPCPYAALRIDLLAPVAGNYTAGSTITNTMTAFILPTTNGSGTAPFQTNKGLALAATGCSTGTCKFTITGLSTAGTYYLRVSSLYVPSGTLSITSGSGASFQGAQVVIDSTGRAQDVLRRIKVAVNLAGVNQNDTGAALISGSSVCKRIFIISSGNYDDYAQTEDAFADCPPDP